METTYHDHLPGSTACCVEPHHEDPCVLPCPGCAVDCDPRFTTTLADVRRRLEIDAWLQEQGAIMIRVEDLGAALEARHLGGRIIHTLTDVVRRIDFRHRHSGELGFHAAHAAHLARRALGLGEGS